MLHILHGKVLSVKNLAKLHKLTRGRAVADELKDQRVVTMMSPTDLETIDEWSFQNRIRSRGEAIRRLCRVGLDATTALDGLRSPAADIANESAKLLRALEQSGDDEQRTELVVNYLFDMNRLVGEVLQAVSRMVDTTANMSDWERVEEAIDEVAKSRTKAKGNRFGN